MKTYVISGSTSGIGKGLVESFKNDDVKIIAIGRNEQKLNELSNIIPNDRLITINVDLENVNLITNALEPIKDLDIDGFIHCAGFSSELNFRRASYDMNIKQMNINFFSFVEILKFLVLHKDSKKQFRVVALSSVASIRYAACDHIYAATKGALDSYIHSVAGELVKRNVEINSLQPVYVNTSMIKLTKQAYGEEFDNYVRRFQPLGILEVEDVVEQIRFLLEKKSKKVTGTSIFINAGSH